MTEVLFYHLTAASLEDAAPDILEKCVERGWRVTLRAGSPERVAALDAHLWTFREDAFLPHGTARDGAADRQPIYLTDGDETPNRPQVLMLVDGAVADPQEMARHERVVLMFDGRDPAAVARARDAWRAAAGAGLEAVYWAQEDGGRWVRKSRGG